MVLSMFMRMPAGFGKAQVIQHLSRCVSGRRILHVSIALRLKFNYRYRVSAQVLGNINAVVTGAIGSGAPGAAL